MFWVTRSIAVGPYPSPEVGLELAAAGVTHVLNVADGRGPFDGSAFEEVAWHPVEDLKRIPDAVAEACVAALWRMLTRPGEPPARVYVHCAAGQNRSPTVIWLFLIACGVSREDARDWIERASYDARGGHPALVDEDLVAWARAYGERFPRPLPRPEILDPPG